MSRAGLLPALVAGAGLWAGALLTQHAGRHHLDAGWAPLLIGLGGVLGLLLCGWAATRLVRRADYPWLMFLAAVAFPLFQPQNKPDSLPWRLASGLWGLALVVLALSAFARMLSRSDELERRIQQEALAFSFAATLVLVVAWTVLQDLLPPLQGVWVAAAMSLSWLVGWNVATRRYL
jgi:MFS family permease